MYCVYISIHMYTSQCLTLRVTVIQALCLQRSDRRTSIIVYYMVYLHVLFQPDIIHVKLVGKMAFPSFMLVQFG